MRVSAFASASPQPVAVGNVVAQLAENIYSVRFEVPDAGTVVEIGTRVVAEKEDGTTAAALVAAVNGDGTFGLLFDSDAFEPAVPRTRISVSGGRLAMSNHAYEKYSDVVDWIQSTAGVTTRVDSLSASIILYRRGWRRENMYLLEPTDVNCLTHLNKSVRSAILEAAEDEKVKRRVQRDLANEKLKETSWRFFIMKYSPLLGILMTACGIMSVFFWNLTNYRRLQRPAQINNAVSSMLRSLYRRRTVSEETLFVQREETDRLSRFLENIDPEHPQLIFLTGASGSGRSTVAVEAARNIGSPFVVVELRGADKADPIRSIVKSCGVTIVESAGDLFQFTNDACQELRRLTGKVPTIILKPRASQMAGFVARDATPDGGRGRTPDAKGLSTSKQGPDLGLVLNDALSLVSDRHCANVVIEIESDVLLNHIPYQLMPRTTVFHVSDMTYAEAESYLARRLDPVVVPELLQTIGTNTVDLDECVGAVLQHKQLIDDVICAKLSDAILRLRRQELQVQALLSEVAANPFHVGVRQRSAEVDVAVDRGLLTFHHENACWIFRTKLLYEAARVVGARN